MFRDTHTLRRSILLHLTNNGNLTTLNELKEVFPSVNLHELNSAVNFLKMVKMVEVEEDLIAKTDSDHATPVALLYNQLKVGRTYDRKQITTEVKKLKLPVSPANAVNQLVKHGGLNKKSGNSFECIALPSLLGVKQVEEEVEEEVAVDGDIEIVSANRRVVWEALSDEPKTRHDLYEELIPLYPSLNKTKIGQNLSLLTKHGCVNFDADTELATQLNYTPFDVDLFYHEIKDLKTINFNKANKICLKLGLNSRPSNLLNSLIQFDAIGYTDTTGVFDVLPLPQLEEVELMELLEEVEEVEETSVDALLTDVRQAKQVYNQLIQDHDLKVKEVNNLRKQIEELTKKADELESEIHSEVSLAKQKLEQAQTAFKEAISVEGLIG